MGILPEEFISRNWPKILSDFLMLQYFFEQERRYGFLAIFKVFAKANLTPSQLGQQKNLKDIIYEQPNGAGRSNETYKQKYNKLFIATLRPQDT